MTQFVSAHPVVIAVPCLILGAFLRVGVGAIISKHHRKEVTQKQP